MAATVDDRDLARDLVLDRLLHEPERVDVLQLGAHAEFGGADRPDRHVGVAPQVALLEIALAHAERAHQPVQRALHVRRTPGRPLRSTGLGHAPRTAARRRG
jgi:hypothetical protein